MNRFVSNTVSNIHSTFIYQRNICIYVSVVNRFSSEKIKLQCDKRIFSCSKDRAAINLFKLYLRVGI